MRWFHRSKTLLRGILHFSMCSEQGQLAKIIRTSMQSVMHESGSFAKELENFSYRYYIFLRIFTILALLLFITSLTLPISF